MSVKAQVLKFCQRTVFYRFEERNFLEVDHMKKFATLLSLLLTISLLAGCVGTPVVYQCDCPEEGGATVEGDTTTPETPLVSEGALRTGLAIVANAGDSKNAGEEDGEAKYDVTVVGITIDEAGIIRSCVIDSIGASVKFDASGVITSDLSAEVPTKNELGDSYGMKAYGGAKYEWYEQAAALARYAVGKTVYELKNGAVNESGKAADADLASTATIYLGGYVAAIEKAAENVQYLGAEVGDELRLAVISSLGSSASASADKAGTAQLDTDVAVITMKGETITSCMIDSVQAKVGFDTTGAITSDLSAPIQTKNELGENYGMKAYAGSKYEWNEQAAAFAAYVTGKTAAEVSGIAVNEKTAPTDADLASTVTIAVGGFQALIAKAADTPSASAQAVKTGLAIVANAADSKSAGEEDGEAKYDVTIVGVTVDSNGVILSCIIDSIGTSVKFDATGVITSDVFAEVLTKNELGDSYGMKAYGGAKYEWYEQAAALAEYAVGKTVDELKNGAVNEAGKAADVDLASTATIYLGGYVSAIEKAVANAQYLGAEAGDELRLAVISSLGTASASADNTGLAQLDTDVAVITLKGETITSCYIDSVQAKVNFDVTGAVAVSADGFQTKNELGEAYGMKAYAGSKYEWNEQAAAFAAYVTGKTAAEVAGIAVSETTAPTDADLAATVTIAVGGFQALIAKACQ